MEWKIIRTHRFEKNFAKLSPETQNRFKKQLERVRIDPYSIGKPLKKKEFRELKNDKFRLYYWTYNEYVIILLLDVSQKNNQQKIIDRILSRTSSYFEYIANLTKNLLKEETVVTYYMKDEVKHLEKENKRLIEKAARLLVELEQRGIGYAK